MRRIAIAVVLVLVAAAWSAAGPDDGAQAAPAAMQAQAQADFNNDGADDLAVGAPTEAVGSTSRAGAVNVLYGSAGGLSGTGSQLFTQDTAGVSGVAEPGDYFGVAVASGDFDGDGFADLAAGADLEDVGTVEDAGAVNVLYGAAGGLSSTGSQVFTQVRGVEVGDRFGRALATGDFDNDGFADLAVGVPLEDVGTAADAGAVNVLYGSASGLTTIGRQQFTQVGGGPEPGDRFGFAVATGDFNTDGFAELAAGAPLEDVGTAVDAGALSEIRGSASGLTTTTGGRIHTERSFGAPERGDQFGYALASGASPFGDTNGVVVGIPGEDSENPVIVNVGALNVFGRSSQGLVASVEDYYFQPSNPEAGDRFATAVAGGDFNNNGTTDIAAGAPLEDVGGAVDAGAVSVLYGDTFLFNPDTFTQGASGVAGSAEPGDRFGAALTAED